MFVDEIIKLQKQVTTQQETIRKYKNKINTMKHEFSSYQFKLGHLAQKDKEIEVLREQLNNALKKQKKSVKDTEKSKKLKEEIQQLQEKNRDLVEQLQASYNNEAWCRESEELNKVFEMKLQQVSSVSC